MTIKASGRSALILAAGLFVCFAGPSHAAATADGTTTSSKPASSKPTNLKPESAAEAAKHATRHWKKVAHRKSSKIALKSVAPPKAADVAADDGDESTALPPSVANANARLAATDLPSGNAGAITAQANAFLQAAQNSSADAQPAVQTQIVAADQINDVDRALHDSRAPAATQAMASADVPAAPVMATSQETSTWDQTSLIGKIFIAFGALLTMASAARMFMA
jgi:hypothetical protein